jgi:hypothetical protein
MGRLFSGKVDTLPAAKSNYFSFYPSETPSPKVAVAFRGSLTSTIEVSGFPFLFALFQTLEDEWFQRPLFEGENATGTFYREGGTVSLRNLNFESKGRMALRGNISMDANQAVSGDLEVGVAEAMILSSSNPRLRTLFGPPKEGFRWLTVKVGGQAAAPTDNFKDLYKASPSSEPVESVAPGNKGSSFEELTSPR